MSKLLLDENLSFRLVHLLSDYWPNSQHVSNVGLTARSDKSVWDFAAKNDFVLVSKDNDFRQLSFYYGAPPKVVWIQAGNASTASIADQLRAQAQRISAFVNDANESLLVITIPDDNNSG